MALFTRRKMLTSVGSAAALSPIALRGGGATAAAPVPPAGPLITLRTPQRVYDSRIDTVLLGGDKIAPGDSIIVTVNVPDDDRFLSSVFLNITITQTEGAGFLTVFATDPSDTLPEPATSNINWSENGQTLANLALSGVGPEFGVEIRCGGFGRTHVVVDLQGYVPFEPLVGPT